MFNQRTKRKRESDQILHRSLNDYLLTWSTLHKLYILARSNCLRNNTWLLVKSGCCSKNTWLGLVISGYELKEYSIKLGVGCVKNTQGIISQERLRV